MTATAVPSVVGAVLTEASWWAVNGVTPTCVVMSPDVAKGLSASIAIHGYVARIWGFPIVLAPGLPPGTWFLATDRPVDAARVDR